jgi:hypothetical protein
MKVSEQIHAPATLTWGKSLLYSLDRKLGGLQSRSGCGGELKNPCHWCESNPGSPTRNLITTLTELPGCPMLLNLNQISIYSIHNAVKRKKLNSVILVNLSVLDVNQSLNILSPTIVIGKKMKDICKNKILL